MKIAFIAFIWLPLLANAKVLEGIAQDRGGKTIYIEKHTIETDTDGLNKLIKVEYFKPDGSLFAKMTSDFSKSKTVPETVFEDNRFKSKIQLRFSSNFVEFEESKDGKTISKSKIPFDNQMVASQGFDNFIKMNFEKIEKGPLDFKFGVLENKDFYSLTGYKKSSTSTEIEFGIKASTWLLRFFAGELRVTYELPTKNLKAFSGRSNILDDRGNAQDVIINYQWKSN